MLKTDMLQGTLNMLVLRTLSSGPLHGYAITEKIQNASQNVLNVEEGSLYPALHRMEASGWIVSEWGYSENNRRARYYQLTASGRKQLEKEILNWETTATAIFRIVQMAS